MRMPFHTSDSAFRAALKFCNLEFLEAVGWLCELAGSGSVQGDRRSQSELYKYIRIYIYVCVCEIDRKMLQGQPARGK